MRTLCWLLGGCDLVTYNRTLGKPTAGDDESLLRPCKRLHDFKRIGGCMLCSSIAALASQNHKGEEVHNCVLTNTGYIELPLYITNTYCILPFSSHHILSVPMSTNTISERI